VALNKGDIMKRYLFGLGAMIVGAGLMFVLMHGEVRADSKPEKFVCSFHHAKFVNILHCQAGNLSCGVLRNGGVSCVKTGIL